ncbi:MAG: 2-phosphosulfolactate phosphatase [Actinobacteria bacterium]|nr:2-phosphosulfolactate phosphatase [Actinomycetota bacterium]
MHEARYLPHWEAGDVDGAVVAVDVIRAFSSAAYAFNSGAAAIHLVADVEEALAFKAAHPGVLAMGENHGRCIDGFDFSNSPVEVAKADLAGCTLVQRTSAGTRGVVAARSATRLWCASLVNASATAAAVLAADLGTPAYVITGRFEDHPDYGTDDLATAKLIERARRGEPLDADATAKEVASSEEAARTLAIGEGHVDPDDIVHATLVDLFDFAMEATREADGLWLRAIARG